MQIDSSFRYSVIILVSQTCEIQVEFAGLNMSAANSEIDSIVGSVPTAEPEVQKRKKKKLYSTHNKIYLYICADLLNFMRIEFGSRSSGKACMHAHCDTMYLQ